MKKHTALSLLSLIYIISIVNGTQDSFISIGSTGGSLCYAVDNKDNAVCENETIQVEGTADHTLYIEPYLPVRENGTVLDYTNFAVWTPISLIGILMFFGIIFAFIILIIVAFGSITGLWKTKTLRQGPMS